MTFVDNDFYNALVCNKKAVIQHTLDTNSLPHPVNTHFEDLQQLTALHVAAQYGHHELVQMFLAIPDISVNEEDEFGFSPLMFGCYNDHPKVVQIFLEDGRSNVNHVDIQGRSPTFWAVEKESHDSVLWLMATSRKTGLQLTDQDDTRKGHPLISAYKHDPQEARRTAQKALGILDDGPASLFVLVVLVCDGFLRLAQPAEDLSPAKGTGEVQDFGRFLEIASKLPMELQMLLCHRVQGSVKSNIPGADFDFSLKCLELS